MPQPDPQKIVSTLRKKISACRTAKSGAYAAFTDVLSTVLHLTVVNPNAHLRLVDTPIPGKAAKVIRGSNGPLPLLDGNYLRLDISLFIESTDDGPRFKTWQSSFQYQKDVDGKDWIFRYDYLRLPKKGQEHVPSAHVQINGEHKKVHFPTMRVPLEAVIRCLAVDFKIPCRQPDEVWQYVLHRTELDFLEIHHPPVSRPR